MNFLKITSSKNIDLRTIFGTTEGAKINWTSLGFDIVGTQEYFKFNPDNNNVLQILAIKDIALINAKITQWQANANHRSIAATLTVINETTMTSDKADFIASLPKTE